MIEVNFLDANGAKILSLKTIEEIETHFGKTVNCAFPNTLLVDLMTKHNRYTLNGTEFYCHQTNIDNISGTITVNYDIV